MDNSAEEADPMFHYTPTAASSSSGGESTDVADLLPRDTRHKIFRRKPMGAGYEPELGDLGYHLPVEAAREGPHAAPAPLDVAEVAERVILRDYSLPCVLVDENFDIVYFNGDTSKYFSQPSGKLTINIIQMARLEIHFKLNLLLKRAFHEKRMAMERDIQVRANDHYFETDIVVRPIAGTGAGDNLMLVVVKSRPKEKKPGETVPLPTNLPAQEKDGRIRALEQVRPTRESFRLHQGTKPATSS
jgi:two-component system CheB/CheR fusion protein